MSKNPLKLQETLASRRELQEEIAKYCGADYDPVVMLAIMSMDTSWPPNLRLRAAEIVARYVRPMQGATPPAVDPTNRSKMIILESFEAEDAEVISGVTLQ